MVCEFRHMSLVFKGQKCDCGISCCLDLDASPGSVVYKDRQAASPGSSPLVEDLEWGR